MTADQRRILLITSGYPDADYPHLFTWNAWQMEALRTLGCQTRVFQPVTYVPRLLAPLSPSLRRKALTPSHRSWNGVEIVSPRVLYGFQLARRKMIDRPGLVIWGLRQAVGRTLAREIRAWRPTGIMVQGGYPWGPVVLEAIERAGLSAPFILIEHSMFDLVRMETRPVLLARYREAAERAAAVVVVGPQMAELARSQLRLPRVSFIPNGAHPPSQAMMTTPRPAALADRFVVLCVTNYYRKKGIEELVEAFEIEAAAQPRALLIIATAAPEALRTRIAESPLRDRIELRGPMPNEEVRQLMAWSDLFAMISWEEAFGIVYAEALMAGCPVLMTSECGASRVFPVAAPSEATAQHAGMVVAPRRVEAAAEALRRAFAEPSLLRRMGESGRAWALATLSWPRHAEGLLAALDGRSWSYDVAAASPPRIQG